MLPDDALPVEILPLRAIALVLGDGMERLMIPAPDKVMPPLPISIPLLVMFILLVVPVIEPDPS